MHRFERFTQPLTWSMALLLVAFVAGCGGGGSDPILGAGGIGASAGAPPGAIIPGATCAAAAGPTIPTVTSSDPTNGNQFVTTSTNGVAGSYLMWNVAAPSFYTTYYQAGMELGAHVHAGHFVQALE